jgi:hypothetical protein
MTHHQDAISLLTEDHRTVEQLFAESLDEQQEVKETPAALDDLDPADAVYDHKVASLIADVRHHVEEEEGEMFPKLRSALSAGPLADIGQKLTDGKATAPTHPHPAAPASSPGPRWPGRPPAWSTGSGTSWATVPHPGA